MQIGKRYFFIMVISKPKSETNYELKSCFRFNFRNYLQSRVRTCNTRTNWIVWFKFAHFITFLNVFLFMGQQKPETCWMMNNVVVLLLLMLMAGWLAAWLFHLHFKNHVRFFLFSFSIFLHFFIMFFMNSFRKENSEWKSFSVFK